MKWLYDYFHLSTGEKYGFWCLMALIAVLMLLPTVLPNPETLAYQEKVPEFSREVAQLMKAEQEQKANQESSTSEKTATIHRRYFKFDPNKLPKARWQQLGLSEKLAQTIINYREAGGRFRQKSDLKAIYGMADSTYQRLKPCMTLPAQRAEVTADTTAKENPEPARADRSSDTAGKPAAEPAPLALNEADSAALTELYGIGDFFAQEIVERRQQLGGYTHYRQLLPIYNFDSTSLSRVKPQLTLDSSKVDKLSLTADSFKTFLRHPYLDYAQVKAMFNYTDRVDTAPPVRALREEQILGEAQFAEIKPYLKP